MADTIFARSAIEARALGLKRYFSGLPCKLGHVAERYAKNGQCLECQLTYSRRLRPVYKRLVDSARLNNRRYRQRNLEALRARSRAAYAAKPQGTRFRVKRWVAANPDKVRVNRGRRRALLRNAAGSHTDIEILGLLKRQRCRCANCSKRLLGRRYHVDHVMPLFLGGSNYIANIQILCESCNRKKNAKDPIVWAQEQGRLL